MNSNFADAIANLWSALGLTPPAADDLQSLSVGEHAVHVTEQPENHVLMFTYIESDRRVNTAMVYGQNLFNANPLNPAIGLDDTSQRWLVWSRQPILLCDAETLSSQIEQLVDCADQFCDV